MKNNTVNLDDIIDKMNQKNFNNTNDDFGDFFIEDRNSVIELRKARWLYLELGRIFIYNMQALSSNETRIEKYNEEVDYNNMKVDQFICKQQCEVFAKALQKIGIDAITVEHDQGYDVNHVGNIFKLSNGMYFYADVTLDSMNIKNGLETEQFACTAPTRWDCQKTFFVDGENDEKRKEFENEFYYKNEILTKREISKFLDIPAMNYKECGMYMNEFLKLLKEEFNNTENVRKYIQDERTKYGYYIDKKSMILRFKFDFLLDILRISDYDYLTGRDYVKTVVKNVFTEEEQRNIQWFNLERDIDNTTDNKEFATCYVVNCKGKLYYYLYRENLPVHSSIIKGFNEKVKKEGWKLPDFKKIKSQSIRTELETTLIHDLELFDEIVALDSLDSDLMKENIMALNSCDGTIGEIREELKKMKKDKLEKSDYGFEDLLYM